MLEHILSKVRQIVENAQETLPVESAAAIESVYGDIVNLNNLIHKKLNRIENDDSLNTIAKKIARREVLEKAERKLEIIKSKRDYSSMIEEVETKLADEPFKKEESILKFIREKEIRDRLVSMTERQIISYFGDSLFDGTNPLLVDAILDAPAGFEILPEEDLIKLREIRVKQMDPKAVSEIETVRNLDYVTMQIFNLIKDELDNLRKKELPLSIVKILSTGTDSS